MLVLGVKSGMVWRTGLAFCLISTVLFACWGLGTVLIVKDWNPINDEAVVTAFGYLGAIFKWPTLATGALGVLGAVIGLLGQRKA